MSFIKSVLMNIKEIRKLRDKEKLVKSTGSIYKKDKFIA